MRASVVIPVWNGASVISECLAAIYTYSGDALADVICVDNASRDDSAALIVDHYPQVHLIRQPVNLGFAGGVNVGIETARADIFVLLNQDCVVQSGWLAALVRAFNTHPEFGIAGCTILKPDGTLDHTGATIHHPDARGMHLTDIGDGQPRRVEYVTGAAFALRRQTWDTVGHFDEGYYPAYYEESDYCYRARQKGIETAYVPEARITHLHSSREWQIDPVKSTANQHLARYRFVTKHFNSHEVNEFFAAEHAAVRNERYFAHAVGRVIAARDTLRNLTDILARRKADLGETLSTVHRRQLQVGFTQLLRQSFSIAEKLAPCQAVEPPYDVAEQRQDNTQRLQALRQREHDLLTRIYFKAPSDDRSEPTLRRLFRLLILRPLSFLIGRDYLLLSELNTVHVARLDQIERHMDCQINWQMDQIDRRLVLLETLADYDYR